MPDRLALLNQTSTRPFFSKRSGISARALIRPQGENLSGRGDPRRAARPLPAAIDEQPQGGDPRYARQQDEESS